MRTPQIQTTKLALTVRLLSYKIHADFMKFLLPFFQLISFGLVIIDG